ncbi:MAG: XRE family transcriptional regulator [Desulfobacterales bacterium]
MEYKEISDKIKSLRKKRNITIQDLADKTDLTPGYLSKIENSNTPPPIPTLAKIAYALKVHVSYFFENSSEQNGGPSIIKKNERKELIGDYTPFGYKYEAIIRKKEDKVLKPLIVTLPHGLDPEKIPYNSHNGEELIYMLSGKMIFYYDDDQHQVEEGDCLYFNSEIPHKVVAATEEESVKILSVLSL